MLINPIISLISVELVGSDLNIGQHVFPSLCASNKLTDMERLIRLYKDLFLFLNQNLPTATSVGDYCVRGEKRKSLS